MKKILLIAICLLAAFAAFAQSHIDKVRQFERLIGEWKSAGYNTGSKKYAQLKSMVSEGCKMGEYIAKAYINEMNASTFDLRANFWFQYIKEKQISISLRDLSEKTGNDGRRIVYCWIKYTQPGKPDKEDFVGFKFDAEKIFYICNNDMERDNRVKADSERQEIDNKNTQQQPAQQHIQARVREYVDELLTCMSYMLKVCATQDIHAEHIKYKELALSLFSGNDGEITLIEIPVNKRMRISAYFDSLISIAESKQYSDIILRYGSDDDFHCTDLLKIDDNMYYCQVKYTAYCELTETSGPDSTMKTVGTKGNVTVVIMMREDTEFGSEYIIRLKEVKIATINGTQQW